MPDHLQVNDNDELLIGGILATDLAEKYNTPLYVYDVAVMRQQMRAFKQAFANTNQDGAVAYASKAFACQAMYQVVAEEGLHLDLVSTGEIYTAVTAGFPMDRVSYNGNNKSQADLAFALDQGVGTIIVDNFVELALLQDLLAERQQTQQIIFRVVPGVSAHTHDYIQTGQVDSKFGFDLESGQAKEAYEIAQADPYLDLLGLSAHIGSQIFEEDGFELAGQRLVELCQSWHFQPAVLDLGGGFGIAYTDEHQPRRPEDLVQALIESVQRQCAERGLACPAIWIEPGRSISGPAGYSLYTVGSRKDIPGVRNYLAVDGGMGDNIRPALYQAKYQAVLANQVHGQVAETVRLVGKYCESGDVLIDEQALPQTKPGDIIAVLNTGAYGYSMASRYNRNPVPTVVFAENGCSQVVVEGETLADLTSHDRAYQLVAN
ncbi:diaminopimelate decarboxylase [Fructobacillus pseudoficulneus]|uniref:Diaminopimelate decarboxylase n=1 Tax=Fructobacillus pseudoficulneus TaxID=220714 RepID=A0A3F3GWP2_9LACO|nr:diaminopimelate decarboxylase [Fructobacillus pseudoficulneus]GAP02657.1 diaminopimelate decarboxylase [Fructobacillus pseudoficulneus]SEH38855.1 diaminopimelate decarboxylase [Fructobacillus pseudoficulneus]